MKRSRNRSSPIGTGPQALRRGGIPVRIPGRFRQRTYIGRRFKNDTERLEKLFGLYTKMTAAAAKRPSPPFPRKRGDDVVTRKRKSA